MKKIIVCLSLVFALSLGVTALAENAEYVGGTENSTTVDASGYRTVLIQNDDTKEIVYVDQDDDYFTAATEFLLQDDPKPGTYTLTLGGSLTEDPKPMTLVISDGPAQVIVSATIMGKEYSEDGNTYDMGCKIENIQASQCKYVVITSTRDNATKTLYAPFSTTLTDEGAINVGIRIDNIEKGVTVTVGVSNTDVAN